jgi:hypothetical protein
MSAVGSTIIFICLAWIVGCYYFLFRKHGDTKSSTSRSEKDVITFHSPEKISSLDPTTQTSEFPSSITLYTETLGSSTPPVDSTVADDSQFNDDDLIDIRTLSLNITNPN